MSESSAAVTVDFNQRWRELNWSVISANIQQQSAADVARALSKSQLVLSDFMALLSPAAEPFLAAMAERAALLTRQRFGHTMGLYVPLYLSNLCANDCSYCGFSMHNRLKRKCLTIEEIDRECQAIKALGFDSILLVAGEHEGKVGADYFSQAIAVARRYFSAVMLEVQPLLQSQYQTLKQQGFDGVMVYQETYHEPTYVQHHRYGKKQDMAWRLATPDRLGQAGVDKIGLGVLLGLSDDWRTDSYFAGEHLRWLESRYWQSRYSLSFPRLRPCTGASVPRHIINDRQLVQLICAWRLFAPTIDLSLSTRESADFRLGAMHLGITQMSAQSSTQPGGYADPSARALAQFSIDDERPLQQVMMDLQQGGLQPVLKDWEGYFGR